jgi:hypothetical protein
VIALILHVLLIVNLDLSLFAPLPHVVNIVFLSILKVGWFQEEQVTCPMAQRKIQALKARTTIV